MSSSRWPFYSALTVIRDLWCSVDRFCGSLVSGLLESVGWGDFQWLWMVAGQLLEIIVYWSGLASGRASLDNTKVVNIPELSQHQANAGNIDGLVQERRNSSALAMELPLSCTDPSIYLAVAVWSSLTQTNHIYILQKARTGPKPGRYC